MDRNHKLDNIRALAILSVVLGHSIILYSSSWNLYQTSQTSVFLDYAKRFINLYQMPLFFALSGYLMSSSCQKQFVCFVRSKARRLLIPFLTIGILYMIPLKMWLGYVSYNEVSFPGSIIQLLLGYESGHLWYLPTLFNIFCLSYPIAKFLGKQPSLPLVAFILVAFLNIAKNFIPTFGVPYLRYVYEHWWSFLLGLAIQKYSLEDRLWKQRHIIAACTAITAVCAIILGRSSLFVSALITVSAFLLVPNRENKVFTSLSSNSFGIYLIHSPLIYITFTYLLNAKPIVVVFMNFIIWGSFSYLLSWIIRKSRLKFILGS